MVLNINQPFGIAIAKVGRVWRTIMDLKTKSRNRKISDSFIKTKQLTIVSSIGYEVLSGNMQVDKHDTTFFTPNL
jgi:hypothetical protein